MYRITNNESQRVVLMGDDPDTGETNSFAVLGGSKTRVPDYVVDNPTTTQTFTESFSTGIFQDSFSVEHDIDTSQTVTVTVDGTETSNYTVTDRPGNVTLDNAPGSGSTVEISYTNWTYSDYDSQGIISTTTV